MRLAAGALLALLLLSACGTTPAERASTGAIIGAAGGAAVGAMVGAPLIGAGVGAAVGATTAAVTDPNEIYLGKPVWK